MGVLHIVDFYAEKMAILFSTVDQSLMNSRFAYIGGANSPAAAATLKAIFDQRNSGKPLIVYDSDKLNKKSDAEKKVDVASLGTKNPYNSIDLEVGKNYITDKLLADYRRLLAAFDEEIGIPNNPIDKAERLVSNEVESNSVLFPKLHKKSSLHFSSNIDITHDNASKNSFSTI